MIRTLTLSAVALMALSLPAAAHKTKIDANKKWPEAQMINGECQHLASEYNMAKIEMTYRAMPQSTRKNMQHVMRHAGLYTGTDDGIWGPKTACAIRAVIGHYSGHMTDGDTIEFFEYMLEGGFIDDYPGTPNPFPHLGILY